MSKKEKKDLEDSWVYDSLVGFLRGPVWHVPVMTFIEQKSLIFEPDTDDGHEKEYKKIFEEYKRLVDFMLKSFMEDIGISEDQFTRACGFDTRHMKADMHTSVFEQVWAADEYEVFKRMMIQKNIELQLQALELLQQKYGILPESLKPSKDGTKKTKSTSEEVSVAAAIPAPPESEQEVMEKVKSKSLAEHQEMSNKMDKERKELEMAIARSMVDQQRLEAQKQTQNDLMENHMMKLSLKSEDTKSSTITSAADPGINAQYQVDPAELKRRTDFLKSQRDKLLAMKRAERDKQLAEAEKSQSGARPKSARAARSAFSGSKIDSDTLKARKALAAKLKQEVVGN